MKSIIDRIKIIADSRDLPISKLEEAIGAGNGTISKAIKRNRSVNSFFLEKIVRIYNINPAWLLLGTGEMSLTSGTGEPFEGKSQSAVAHSTSSLDYEGSVSKRIPILDIQAAAGYPMEIDKPKFLEDLPVLSIDWHQFKLGEHVMIQIRGESMQPTIYSGDYVICRKLYDFKNEIRDGYIHVVVTLTSEAGEVVCKRILNRLANKKHLVLQSDNRDFPPLIEPASNILEVWRVEYKLSANLRNESNDVYSRIKNLEGDVAEIQNKLKL